MFKKLALSVVAILALTTASSTAAETIKAGGACKTAGVQASYKGTNFVCALVKTKKKWIAVGPSKASPSAQANIKATCDVIQSGAQSEHLYDDDFNEAIYGISFGFLVRNASPMRDAKPVVVKIKATYSNGQTEDINIPVKRIPAGQTIGFGYFNDSMGAALIHWTYKIQCSDAKKSSFGKFIEPIDDAQIKWTPNSLNTGSYSLFLSNSSKNVFKCNSNSDINDCYAYSLIFDQDENIVGGDINKVEGVFFPDDDVELEAGTTLTNESGKSYRVQYWWGP